jgi:aromatic-L-amino-acid decarboxylase
MAGEVAGQPAHRREEPGEVGDLDAEEFRRLAHQVADWMADYLGGVGELPVFPAHLRPGDIRTALPSAPPEEGEPLDAALDDVRTRILPGITHWNHPAFFAWFAITGSAPGILGEMMAAALNVNAMLWRSSPAATELEELSMDWLRQLVGLPEGFDGVINDTASTSTLYALAAARQQAWPRVGEEGLSGAGEGRVYASEHAHSSVEKAVMALGLGRRGYRAIPTDAAFRMDVRALRAALAEDVAAGIRPVAVVPTLGTTSTTAVDPVAEAVEAAREHGAWVHVDAAYGGPAALLPEISELFRGWEEADSIVVNPHKWLFTPVDCSALYCRRPDELVRAFSLVPAYLESPEGAEARNLMDYGVALGRRFRALKLWLVIRAFGRRGLAARIRHHIDLARRFAAWVEEEPGWEVVAPVPMALVVLRHAPPGASPEEADAANRAIVERVNATGEAFLGPSELRGRVVIRLAVGNLRTEEAHLARTWALLREAAEARSPV